MGRVVPSGDRLRPRALIVDLFGTLVPKWSSRRSTEAKARMAERLGIESQIFLDAWNARSWNRELGLTSIDQCLLEMALGSAPVLARGVIEEARDLWIDCERDQLHPRVDALSTLQCARAAGLRIGLLSNAGPAVPSLFRATSVFSFIDAALFSCEVGLVKPDPAIYSMMCRQLSVLPEECVYLGDGGNDELGGASRVGMTAVLLRVDDEIQREGLPGSVEMWQGPVVGSLKEILGFVDVSAGAL